MFTSLEVCLRELSTTRSAVFIGLMKTADRVVESSLKQTSKLVNKKQLELQSARVKLHMTAKNVYGCRSFYIDLFIFLYEPEESRSGLTEDPCGSKERRLWYPRGDGRSR